MGTSYIIYAIKLGYTFLLQESNLVITISTSIKAENSCESTIQIYLSTDILSKYAKSNTLSTF